MALPELTLEILPEELQNLAHIGQGGFGRVYRATYTRTNTPVGIGCCTASRSCKCTCSVGVWASLTCYYGMAGLNHSIPSAPSPLRRA